MTLTSPTATVAAGIVAATLAVAKTIREAIWTNGSTTGFARFEGWSMTSPSARHGVDLRNDTVWDWVLGDALLLALSVAMVVLFLRAATAVTLDLLERNAILEAFAAHARFQHSPLPHDLMWGGGGDVDSIDIRATHIAGALRQLGETVNAPGLKAIKGVLLMLQDYRQIDAASQTGSTVKSIRKYQPLVEKVLASACSGAVLAVAAAAAGPCTAATVCGAAAAAALPPMFRLLPNVTNVSLRSEIYHPQDGRIYRVWCATVKASDGSVYERDTKPVLHESAPDKETADERRKREDREHKRVVRALRVLDEQSVVEYRTKDRERKRAKAARRLSRLPALPIPEDDPAWSAPLGQRPHFVGEHVWLISSDASAPPMLACIQALYRDGSAMAVVQHTQDRVRVPAEQILSLGVHVPVHIGQQVEVRDGQGEYQCAEVRAVYDDGIVDAQLFNASSRSFDGIVAHRLDTQIKVDTAPRVVEIMRVGDDDRPIRTDEYGHWQPHHWGLGMEPGWVPGYSKVVVQVFSEQAGRWSRRYHHVIATVTALHERDAEGVMIASVQLSTDATVHRIPLWVTVSNLDSQGKREYPSSIMDSELHKLQPACEEWIRANRPGMDMRYGLPKYCADWTCPCMSTTQRQAILGDTGISYNSADSEAPADTDDEGTRSSDDEDYDTMCLFCGKKLSGDELVCVEYLGIEFMNPHWANRGEDACVACHTMLLARDSEIGPRLFYKSCSWTTAKTRKSALDELDEMPQWLVALQPSHPLAGAAVSPLQLRTLADANESGVRKRRGHGQLPADKRQVIVRPPKFVRVAERMKRWRQTRLDWKSCKRQRLSKRTM